MNSDGRSAGGAPGHHHGEVVLKVAHLLLHLDRQQRTVAAVTQDLLQRGGHCGELLRLHGLHGGDKRLVRVRLEWNRIRLVVQTAAIAGVKNVPTRQLWEIDRTWRLWVPFYKKYPSVKCSGVHKHTHLSYTCPRWRSANPHRSVRSRSGGLSSPLLALGPWQRVQRVCGSARTSLRLD